MSNEGTDKPYRTEIAVMNRSTVWRDDDVREAVAAVQIQVSRDFAPLWGVDAELTFWPKGVPPPPHFWQVVVADDPVQAGNMGFHELTPAGQPLGHVFAKATLENGGKPSQTLSHEVLEMLADPEGNLMAIVHKPDGSIGFYAYEICDPVEDDRLGYEIDGVLVSDFVTPAWFEPSRPEGTRVSFMWSVRQALQLGKGGYISYMDAKIPGEWQQINELARKATHRPESRRHDKRNRGHHNWRRSKP